MPLKSKAQVRWAHTPKGTKALGGKKALKEWEKDTDFENLPERVTAKKPAEKAKPGPRMRHTTR